MRLEGDRLDAWEFFEELDALVAWAGDAEVIGLDVPLGHEDPRGTRDQGRRACDVAARRFLGRQASSVFHVPPPSLLKLEYAQARKVARQRGWLAPSVQLWNLRDNILAAEAAARRDPRLREVHPEVSFLALHRASGGEGPLAGKHTWNGLFERLELLRAAGLRPSRSLGGVGRASPDDVLDATIVAWTAQRLTAGKGATLPERPPEDPRTGRPVAISY